MVERIWLFIRKRVVSPVILFILGVFLAAFFVLLHMGKNIPMLIIVGIIYTFSLIIIQIGYYGVTNRNVLKGIKEGEDYDKRYEKFTKEVEWYLLNETSDMRVYIYPGWTKYFHVYLMELLRNHGYREITDATVLAALTKALVMKHDKIDYVAEFIDSEADRFRMPQTYTVKKEKDGSFSFEVKERKVFHTFDHMELVFGMDFIAEQVKRLLKDNVPLKDLEEFYDDLYYCGKGMDED